MTYSRGFPATHTHCTHNKNNPKRLLAKSHTAEEHRAHLKLNVTSWRPISPQDQGDSESFLPRKFLRVEQKTPLESPKG